MLLSASALAYEILLMRLFSIIQWHHFAYMIIGLALLGYGISGSVVSIFQKSLLSRYTLVYSSSLFLFSISSVVCFLIAQFIPFNAEEILWDWHQSIFLLVIFILLAVPFFFAASAICLTFIRYSTCISRVYAVDLIGAGIGSLGVVYLLFLLFPQTALIAISIIGLIAVLVGVAELKMQKRISVVLIVVAAISILIVVAQYFQLHISPYKGLQQSLRISGTNLVEQRSSPLGLLSVIESKQIPLRHAPGLSLNAMQEPPEQLGVFTDADNMTVITRSSGDNQPLSYLDQMSSALPYHLAEHGRVLIVGAGGGSDILQAGLHHVPTIDAIELNPQMIGLVSDRFRVFSNGLYEKANVNIHIGDARDFMRTGDQQYDLIQLALLDAFNASASGLYALNENYLYTTEAMRMYLEHLTVDGYVAITRWIKIPPRDTLKLFATAIAALKDSGVQAPAKRLVLIRSWQTSTLLIKNGELSPADIQAITAFCDERSFDIAYAPGISEQQVNRYNVLRQPYFYTGALSLLGDKHAQFLDQYKFNLEPATDDRPYFNHFFKWKTLAEIIQLRGKGGMPLVEWGYVILIATLLVAVLVSILLILLPLLFLPRENKQSASRLKRTHIVLYFFLVGLAFLFIEIAFMQKFILFLHHPVYAISVSLAAFLVFAGLGSHWSTRLAQQFSHHQVAIIAVVAIAVLSLLYLMTLGLVFNSFSTASANMRTLLTIMLIAPLAFFMGMPFPSALSSLDKYDRRFIPWAWGINGCASVISAVLASLLALHFGFTTVIVLAVLLYIAILFLFPVKKRAHP
jgi:hypothetical protein